ncbi:MAG TPA: vWA domain-containing protein [Planctomycetota bacterium]
MPALILACCLLAQSASRDLHDLERTLRTATDPAGWEAARDARKDLAARTGPAAMDLRVELYERFFRSYRGVYLRDDLYAGMLGATTLAETAVLADAALDRRHGAFLRELCLHALSSCPAPVPAKPLLDPHWRTATGALGRAWQDALGKCAAEARLHAASADAAELADRARALLVRGRTAPFGLAWFADLDGAELQALAQAAQAAPDPHDRALALRRLPETAAHRATLLGALADPHPAPLAAALDRVLAIPLREAAPVLIDMLRHAATQPGPRCAGDLAAALRELTGQQMGAAAGPWEQWWAARGRDWLAAGVQPPTRAPSASAEPDATVARLFELPVDSLRVAVLVDGSGSMRHTEIGGRPASLAAADELARYLEALPAEARFDCWLVTAEPQPVFGALVAPRRGNRERALQRIRKHDFVGTSALADALLAAQEVEGVDTLVLISDGGSSAGRHHRPEFLLQAARRAHERTGVRIHCIGVAPRPRNQRFLEQLAALTGGRMVLAAAAAAPQQAADGDEMDERRRSVSGTPPSSQDRATRPGPWNYHQKPMASISASRLSSSLAR